MQNLEAICVEIRQRNGFLYIYCLYIQPELDREMCEAHVNAINSLEIGPNDTLLIAGDLNLPIVEMGRK